ncbi:hypothetical protein ABFS82_13G015400 [Erythranthe guttata]|uniref:DUF674 domain-containing protein n=1 Tax=Erythranthe guttata TaxID=4155 RepID=A0A022R1B7_ERYGU|nr:PREDICTED: uncharacterized protein LOC105961745 [Erythranthe guttata]EYU34026.1 hypothetical protein MIMGU_mgv1a005416mg [Erythranthe guttata]|eukprot:XP_012841455.1 PREDICTED: uncharacterized protein LOC105961745 [Erythranthe guttata]
MADKEPNGAEFTLKVMVNKQKTKVLFAEIESDFADVLLSFLTLPLGKIVRVLKKHYADDQLTRVNIGSLTTLYDGLSNLNNVCFWTDGCKEMLLDPRSSLEAECRKLKLDIHETQSTKYFLCENSKCSYSTAASVYRDTVKCSCGKTMKREVDLKEFQSDSKNGVFTINAASFLISDNLRMMPNVAVSIMQTLTNLGITDSVGAELMNVTFRFDEVMDLLKGSLLSQTPLTDIVFKKGKIESATKKYETETVLDPIEKEADSNSKKMILKLMVQESTNKLLFAQAEEDFVDFLFSLLTIPLGGVLDCVLGSVNTITTGLKSIENLYKSVATLIDDKYLVNPDAKTKLMKPKLIHGCMPKNQILPLNEESSQRLCYNRDVDLGKEWLSYSYYGRALCLKGQRDYVKGPTMYMVSDDLTVAPLCMIASLSIMKEMKIPLSDVKEVEVQIGLHEALSILKASLTSTCALTDGLMIKPVSIKKPKREH